MKQLKAQAIIATITTITVIVILFSTIAFVIPAAETKANDEMLEHLYPLYTVVYEVCPTSDLVVVRAFNGNLFSFHPSDFCEDWEVGDICSIIMDDNGTPEVKDDIIVATRYGGWVD